MAVNGDAVRRIDIDGPDAEWDGFGRLVHNGELFTGEAVTVEDGKTLALTTYQDGRAHGPQWEIYSDGTKRHDGMFDHGNTVGEWRAWFPNGRPQSNQVFDRWGDLRKTQQWDEYGGVLEDQEYDGTHFGEW
jgi:antitoxin component YwqK of YwqJK toxin-antitoxin module